MIKYRHYRIPNHEGKPVVTSRGGATIAYLQMIDTDTGRAGLVAAAAYCNPKDNYSKAYGRAKSGGRLIQNASCNFNLTDGDKYFYWPEISVEEALTKLDRHMSDQGMVRRGGGVRL